MTRPFFLAFALLNATLYCFVLPLWEGFDEPFHYAYVESFSIEHRIPVFGETKISAEIRRSLSLTPLSWLFSSAIPGSTSFQDWARLPLAQKQQREAELHNLAPDLRRQPSEIVNYEAQQTPLAYVLLAPLDALFGRVPLRARILILRLFCTIAGTVLLFFAVRRLSGSSGAFQIAMLACVFESEMLWASMAHVGNDWLAIPLTVWFLAELRPRKSSGPLALALIFSAGLLTKAYFLAFTPVFAVNIICRRTRMLLALAIPVLLAGPWYARNVLLYGSLSGTQQSVAGIGLWQVLGTIPRINWLKATTEFVRWSLWTGNWSFLSFSRATIDCEALLLLVAFALYLFRSRNSLKTQAWMLAACECFLLALIYQTCATWIHTNGASTHPEPWYAEGIIVCLWTLCFAGLEASGWFGRASAIALTILSAWIAALTYVAKLLPYYGGLNGRSTGHSVLAWWTAHPSQALYGVTLGPQWAVYALLVAFCVSLIGITALAILSVTKQRKKVSI